MALRPSQRAAIEKMIESMAPNIRKAFLEAIQDLKSSAQAGLIADHLDRGDVDAAIAAMNIKPAFFAPVDEAIRGAYLAGGRDAIAALPAIADPFLVAR